MQAKIATNRDLWMISFIDLIMLLIAFFILLYASNLKPQKSLDPPDNILDLNDKLKFTNIINLDYLESLLKTSIVLDKVNIIRSENSLILKIYDKDLIDEYSNISLSGKDILEKIDAFLVDIGNKINLIYHINLEKKFPFSPDPIYLSAEICSKILSFLQKQTSNNVFAAVNINYLLDKQNTDNFLELVINVY